MDFQGSAELEWVANSTFSITAPVQVQVTAVPLGWLAQVTVATADEFRGLLAFGNPYQVRFGDGSVIDVGLGDPDDSGVFPMWDWAQEGDRPRPCRDCGSALVRTETMLDADQTVTLRDMCSGCGRQFVRAVTPPT